MTSTLADESPDESAIRHQSCNVSGRKPTKVLDGSGGHFNSRVEAEMSGAPRGDVFSEMKGCLDQGISGRPSLARFVEITYEAILELKQQIDQLRARRPRIRLKRKQHREQPKNRDGRPGKS